MYKIIIAVFVLVLLISCDSAEMFTASTIEAPVVPGIFVNNELNQPIQEWETPYSPSYEFPNTGGGVGGNLYPLKLRCSVYPNPSYENFMLSFSIPYEGHLKITVVPALGPGSDSSINSTNYSSNLAITAGKPIITLMDQHINGDFYSYLWNGLDDEDSVVPDGFYRVYLKFEDYLIWVDLFKVVDPEDLPPGMIWPYYGWE
jgi:hypothetical protein